MARELARTVARAGYAHIILLEAPGSEYVAISSLGAVGHEDDMAVARHAIVFIATIGKNASGRDHARAPDHTDVVISSANRLKARDVPVEFIARPFGKSFGFCRACPVALIIGVILDPAGGARASRIRVCRSASSRSRIDSIGKHRPPSALVA